MIGNIRLSAIATLAVLLGTASAVAQSAGPDEMVTPSGAVSPQLALTAAQRSAIYNAVMRARARPSLGSVPVAIGAAVPPAVNLRELPDQASADDTDDTLATRLKYAVVEDNIVVVDPIRMRVVDIIRGTVRP